MSEENRIYESYGRFAIQFERVCNALEVCVQTILEKEGLKNKNIHEVILADMTANPLQSLAHSLLYEHINPEGEECVLIDSIFREFNDLISKRNNLLHGKLFVFSVMEGDNPATRQDIAHGSRLHKNKKGTAPKELEYTNSDLEELYQEAVNCFNNICKLRNCLNQECSLICNFEKTENKKYVAKSGECVNEVQ